jgi:hypothetical protein
VADLTLAVGTEADPTKLGVNCPAAAGSLFEFDDRLILSFYDWRDVKTEFIPFKRLTNNK